MSGHSKWSQIKHKKGVTDQKRGQLFSKLLKAVSVAARDNPDPQFNPRLRAMIEKAKDNNVPNDNIERAVKKAAVEKNFQEILIEAYGPEKSAFIIEAITDNKNRTLNAIKNILSDHQAKMANSGSVLWSFRNNQGTWEAQFQQTVSADAESEIVALVAELEDHEDVQRVTTNISNNVIGNQ